MTAEINKVSEVKLILGHDNPLSKSFIDSVNGQILKLAVIAVLNADEVLININGHNIPAKTTQLLRPGDELHVKVIIKNGEAHLQIQDKPSEASILQDALRQALPKQASAIPLLNHLQQVLNQGTYLSPLLNQTIKELLQHMSSIEFLPQTMQQSILLSGLFLEGQLKQDRNSGQIKKDFKGLCLKLLQVLKQETPRSETMRTVTNPPDDDSLHLLDTIPQPISKKAILDLMQLNSDAIKQVLQDEVTQVLARITAHQINQLSHDPKLGYFLMLDIPIMTKDGIDVIPLSIREHKAQPMQPAKWSISFALNLSQLGAIQGTVDLTSHWIDMKFNIDKPDTIELLKQHQAQMELAMVHLGFEVRDFKMNLGLEKGDITSPSFHLLDVKI